MCLEIIQVVERVTVARDELSISLTQSVDNDDATTEIRIPWSGKSRTLTGSMETDGESVGADNEILVRAIVRAHAWKQSLLRGTHASVENLPRQTGCIQRSSAKRFG